jgi:hypothetical protein
MMAMAPTRAADRSQRAVAPPLEEKGRASLARSLASHRIRPQLSSGDFRC